VCTSPHRKSGVRRELSALLTAPSAPATVDNASFAVDRASVEPMSDPSSRAAPAAMPTVLPPSARLLWRSPRAAQIEIGARRVVVDGITGDTVRRLIADAAPAADTRLDAVRSELLETGFLWPGASGPTGDAGPAEPDPRRAVAHPRLAGELAALSARAGERAGELLDARRHSTVLIQGAGRVGPHVGAVLAAAGIGRVHTVESGRAGLHHAMPGGLTPADEGLSFAAAAAAAAERQAPETVYAMAPFDEPPDLVVLAVDAPVDPERRAALHARCAAHLVVQVSAGHGAVGPLVLPGLTSCLRCADLHRLDRDPAWDALAAQLSVAPRHRAASEVALASVIGGLAAVQALDFLDGGRPATIEATLEMQLPDWRLRRRSWPIHPECDCLRRGRS
jgi:hypothetical protein